MNTRRLRYLVAVADFGNFTRAAEYLHVEQPPLTQQIRALERELGVTLFVRSNKGATLTDIGALLVERARILLQHEQSLIDLAASFARGDRGHLRIGMAWGVSFLSLVPYAIELFRQQWADIGITLEENSTAALCSALHSHQLDVAILRGPIADPSMTLRVLAVESAVIVLPKGHAMQQSAELRLNQLVQSPLIIFHRNLAPGFYDAIIAAYQQSGFTPQLGPFAPQLGSVIPMVAAGLGVGIVPAYLNRMQTNGVTFHSIAGVVPKSTIVLASSKLYSSRIIQRFETVLLQLCERLRQSSSDQTKDITFPQLLDWDDHLQRVFNEPLSLQMQEAPAVFVKAPEQRPSGCGDALPDTDCTA